MKTLLLWGPPGTGKSRVLAGFCTASGAPSLICSEKNEVIRAMARRLLKAREIPVLSFSSQHFRDQGHEIVPSDFEVCCTLL